MKSRSNTDTIIILLALLAAFGFADASRAQQDGDPVAIGTYRTLDSQVLGEKRTLLVSLPGGYEETAISYPVLYVLYGGQVRGYFAEAVHIVDRLQEAGLIPRMIIVGIKNVDRYRDNLPVGSRGEEGGGGVSTSAPGPAPAGPASSTPKGPGSEGTSTDTSSKICWRDGCVHDRAKELRGKKINKQKNKKQRKIKNG